MKVTAAEEQVSGSPGRREVHRHLCSLCERKKLALKCLASAPQYLHKWISSLHAEIFASFPYKATPELHAGILDSHIS